MLQGIIGSFTERAQIKEREAKLKLIEPIFSNFYTPQVIFNAIGNPEKLFVLIAVYSYWRGIPNRPLAYFAATDFVARINETEKILSVINHPNLKFLKEVRDVSDRMGEGDLRTSLQKCLRYSDALSADIMIERGAILGLNVCVYVALNIVRSVVTLVSPSVIDNVFSLLFLAQAAALIKSIMDHMDDVPQLRQAARRI